MYKFTSLARPLDFSYRSNQFIAALSLTAILFGSGFQLATGNMLLYSTLWGLQLGFSVFLTWALAREIDPDFPSSAAAASLLAIGTGFFLPSPALGVLFWFLIASRLLNRSTGVNPKLFDYFSFTALSIWQTIDSSALYGFLGCIVLILDYFIGKKFKCPVLSAGLLLAFSFYWLFTSNQSLQFSFPDYRIISGLLILGITFLLVVYRSKSVETSCDISTDLLSPLRVQTCQIINLTAPVLGLLLLRENLLWDLIPILTAIAAVSLNNLVYLIGETIDQLLSQ